MQQQIRIEPLTEKLLTTMYEKGLSPSTRVKIIRKIIHSTNEDKMTMLIIDLLENSTTEQEILEKVQNMK